MSKRHGQLADTNTRISVVLSKEDKELLQAAARADDRTLSKWAGIALAEKARSANPTRLQSAFRSKK